MSHLDFDVGSLIWVKAEIDSAIGLARQHAQQFAADPADATQLKFAQTHVHQVTGALEMVGLDGLTAFAQAIEALLRHLGEHGEADPAALALIDRALSELADYIAGLVDGAPNATLRLFSTYRALHEAAGSQQFAESDLFYPDLSVAPPKSLQSTPVSSDVLRERITRLRGAYQAGLLKWLKGNDPAVLAELSKSLAQLMALQQSSGQKAFWWVAEVFVQALAADARLLTQGKPLLSKLDLQMRRLSEGTPKQPDTLVRQMLYLIAVADARSEQLDAVREAYQLNALLPEDHPVPATLVSPQTLRQLREGVEQAKDLWMKATTGQTERVPTLRQALDRLAETAEGQGLALLVDLLRGTGRALAGSVDPADERRAMDVATALLLAEAILQQYPNTSADLPQLVSSALDRLSGGSSDAPLLDQISQRAQERLLLEQVTREIQHNLQQVEQQLDSFFRDPSQRAGLAQLDPLLHQIDGAFTMFSAELGQKVLASSRSRVQHLLDPAAPVATGELEQLAEALSALGFYVEALRNQREDADQVLAPVLARLGELEAATPAPVETAEPTAELLPALDWSASDAEALAAPVEPVVAEAPPAPTPVPAAATEATVDEPADAELLDIYLEEARDILSTLGEHIETCRDEPHQRDSLTVIRRSFHTLKGSGRMVGLTYLGEVAWAIEQVMNKWLQEDRPASPALLDFIELACQGFSRWVDALSREGRAEVDADHLLELAEQFKRYEGGPWPVVPAATSDAVLAVKTEEPEPESEPIESEPVQVETVELEAATPPVQEAVEAAPLQDLASFELDGLALAEPEAPPVVSTDVPDLSFDEPVPDVPTLEWEDTPEPAPLVIETEETAEPAAEAESEAPAEAALMAETVDELDDLQFEEGEAPSPEVLSVETSPDAELDEPSEFVIGDTTLSSSLYYIFTVEAQRHLDTLDEQLPILADGRLVQQAAVHAAHTLRGIGNTAGFRQVGSTAEALEQFLLAKQREAVAVDGEGLVLVAEAIATLHQMLEAIEEKTAPAAADDLVAQLHAHSAAVPVPSLEESLDIADHEPGFEVDLDAELGELDLTEAAEPVADTMDFAEAVVDESVPVADTEPEAPAEEVPAADTAPEASTEPLEPLADEDIEAMELVEETHAPLAIELDDLPDLTAEAPLVESAPIELEAPQEDLPAEPAPVSEAPEPAVAAAPPAPVAETPAPVGGMAEVSAALAAAAAEEVVAHDDIDPQLLPVFLEEGNELLPEIGNLLRAWRQSPGDSDIVAAILRSLHTLKGSARMAGAMRIGEVTHGIETRVLQAQRVRLFDSSLFDALEGEHDQLASMLERLAHGEPTEVAAAATATTTTPEAAAEAEAHTSLRVRADVVDRLVNEAGEVAIGRARIEAEMRTLKHSLLELTDNVARLRHQLRELEIQAESQMQSRMSLLQDADDNFDPLEFDRFTRLQELTRLLAESVNDVATVQHNLLKNVDDSEAALLAQSRTTRELQQSLMRIRTVPLSTLADRLYRIVRQTAKELGKKANLEIRGGRVELDRSVLEKMTGPFEHMLRNAIDHGLEDRDARVASGKPEIGDVVIEARQEGNEMILTLRDDGAGIDPQRVRQKAIEKGLLSPDEDKRPEELLGMIFVPGFSTADTVTQLSGRGVGMDVVKSEIESLGGRVEVSSVQGEGTTFTLHLPLTLAVTQTVLVHVGNRQFAVPSGLVEQVQELKLDALNRVYAEQRITWQGNDYPFWYLPRLLGDNGTLPEPQRYNTVMLLKSANRRVAVHVDRLTRNQEVVVKNIGPQLARVIGVAGATVLGSGEIVLIINPVELASHAERLAATAVDAEPAVIEQEVAAPLQTQPLIQVVDDSLTVRKITGRLLERQGYQVLTAKDGVEALQQLQDLKPDVMLVDIEMPRMDGFELTRNVRSNAGTRDIPIVMISSRTADKHRKFAADLGVNLFLGKPYQEEELLEHIRHFLAEKAAAATA